MAGFGLRIREGRNWIVQTRSAPGMADDDWQRCHPDGG